MLISQVFLSHDIACVYKGFSFFSWLYILSLYQTLTSSNSLSANSSDSLVFGACNLQTGIIWFPPFQFISLWILFLVWCLWLKPPEAHWVTMVKMENLVWVCILAEMHPTFPNSIWCWQWVCRIFLWFYRGTFHLYPIYLRFL